VNWGAENQILHFPHRLPPRARGAALLQWPKRQRQCQRHLSAYGQCLEEALEQDESKERHFAASATISFGELSDEVAASHREITHSFYSYSVDCSLTGAIDVEIKCGTSMEVPRVSPKTTQKSTTICVDFDALGCAHRKYKRPFERRYAQVFPDFSFRARF
jgi:hypothetical protein